MKFKEIFNKVFFEEKIPNQNSLRKALSLQAYYFLCLCFKLKVLYNKEACDKTIWNHWFRSEFLGNSLKRVYFYFTGKISKEEIIKALLVNIDFNIKRLKSDMTNSYKDLVDKDDLNDEKIKRLAIECYSRLADCLINNRPTKEEISKEEYEKIGNYIINKEEN